MAGTRLGPADTLKFTSVHSVRSVGVEAYERTLNISGGDRSSLHEMGLADSCVTVQLNTELPHYEIYEHSC
jgi:hypothetical protein